ncbi:non-ribosomal peptide synthase/polyketide synthase, partial [Lentzea sp. CC55]|uniref:non-ribosomal peptide synthase/polyketide synthase n=1 Tax=Lentzea sp. CC55 TaxID=2884909 RepID=UPI0027E01808
MERRAAGDRYSLTAAQVDMWLSAELLGDTPEFNPAQYVVLRGPLDVERLRAGARVVAEETEAYQLFFGEHADGSPWQAFADELPADVLPVVDLRGEDDPAGSARAWMRADSGRPLDHRTAPLWRWALLRVADGENWWYHRAHHLITDLFSFALITRRVAEVYAGDGVRTFGSWADVVAEDRAYRESADRADDERYWLESVAEAVRSRETERRPERRRPSRRRTVAVDGALRDAVLDRSAELGLRVPHFLVSAFAAYQRELTGRDDVVFSLPTAARRSPLARTTPGLLANVARLALHVPEGTTIRQLADATAARLAENAPRSRYRGEDLARKLGVTGGGAWFGPTFNVVDFSRPLSFGPDVHAGTPRNLAVGPIRDLTVTTCGWSAGDRAWLDFDVEDGVAAEAELALHEERFLSVLDRLARGPVADAPRPSTVDLARTRSWGTGAAQPDVACVPDLVADHAGTRPGATAVVCGDERLTFGELGERADALAARLRQAGVTAGSPVAVLVPRGLDLAVAFQGVLRSGGVYVPINPGLPAERLAFLLADAGVVAAVTTSAPAGELTGFAGDVLLLDDHGPAGSAPPVGVDPDAVAYLAYTSGSTGRPKGVAVTHRALSSYVAGWTRALEPLGGAGTVLSMSGPGFDVSIGDMTRALAFGRTLVFLPHDEAVSVESLHRTLAEHRVEVAEIVPGMLLRDLAAHCREAGPVESLRLVISGTDMWTYDALTAAVEAVAPNAVPGNVFGVTEAAIDSVFHPVVARPEHEGEVVPIGVPLAGVDVFVVDGLLRPVPVGVEGELLVGGAGVAQGYVGRPDLTAERFLPDVFGGSGGRLYRTGDRARWRADGVLEFLGRVDEQVKIRGYRVEPGEVEVVIGDHPGVRDVVVVARDGGPHGGKRLVAYVVAEDTDVSGQELRSWLRERVPDYLVPSVFVALERLPVTPNGKVDRRGLPDPEPETTGVYEAPRSSTEDALAAVWSGVLGVERVGVHDNFFELGGDSILSLQIVARARAAGLNVDVADVLSHQTVAGLAAVVRDTPAVTLAEQGVVTGPVPLTPIQRWFTAQDVGDPDHWNWSGVFELAPGTDPGRLAEALDTLVAHHDALRLRFSPEGQHNAGVEAADLLRVVEGDSDVVAEMTVAQKSLRLADGPLLAAVFFDRGDEPAWLGLVVHHLVMDGVSWNVLLEDLGTAYRSEALPAKTTSFRQWAELLQTFDAAAERDHWAAATSDVVALPVDGGGPNDERSSRVHTTLLTAATTAALLGDAHKAYRTQGNDLLLAALVRTLGPWAGADTLTIDLESHGREAIADGVDLSRTVGWFTSIFPVRLSRHEDLGATVKAVKEQLRAVPRRGVGYGALRWLHGELSGAPDRPVLFNYLGSGAGTGDLLRRELPVALRGAATSGHGTRSHVLNLEVTRTADGQLQVEWHYSAELHEAATVARLAETYRRELEALVEHCRSGVAGLTPSDFPLASLAQDEVDRLAARFPGLADVYRLAPVQSGMLFGVAGAPAEGDGLYWGQGIYELTGTVDADRLARAWQEVISRQAALRSAFVWEGVSEPVQVVLEGVDVPLQLRDWSDVDGDVQDARLRELLAQDRALGFDPAAPPLTRLYLADRGHGRYWLVWGLYQGLCDGWSLPVVVDEVSAAYEGTTLAPARSYREFIAWLDRRDPAEPESFWRSYLDGFEAPTPLPVDRLATHHHAQDRRGTALTPDVTAKIVDLARRERVTLSAVVQAAWAKVLSASSGEDDVVFGLTVSGRPPELAGVESTVGLFINTLPVRTTVPADVPFTSWLRDLRDNQVAVQRYEYTPLVDAQRWSSVPAGRALFDSIVVLRNYPGGRTRVAGFELSPLLDSVEQGNYPLTFAVDVGETLRVEAEFSTAAFDAATVDRVLDQLAVVLTAVAERPDLLVRDVPLQRPEQAAVLVAWGETPEPATERPVPDLVDDWARISPEVAVICGDERLTFAELGFRAEALAGRLQRTGVTVGSRVAVLVPRGVDLAVAFQGVLRSGGVYVPVNPGLPAERLAFLLADAGASVVVTTSSFAGEVAGLAEVLLIDDEDRGFGALPVPVDPHSLAYIAYTSGSTGRPKGVAVTHAALSSYVAGWRRGLVELGGPGTVLSMSGPGFDVSIGDMTRALAFGRTVVFLPHDEHVTVESLHRTLVDHEVEVAEIVPGMLLRDLAAHCREAGPVKSLRLVISGTDMWTHDALTGAVADVAPNALAGNVFGVTEAAIDSIFHPVTEDHPASVVPIGTPLAGARAFVVDGAMRPVPVGVPGELLVGGAGVAQGYVGRADLTATRFVPDVFGGSGGRLYRTGDRARWRADGVLEFLGRVDEQVKIRGYRVEPGEVEVVLGDHPDVRDVVVVARDGGPHGGKRLVAYVVAEDAEVTGSALRSWLRERVPDYLVPSVFVALERLPLTPNGKVDRRGLPEPEPEAATETYVAPRNAVEETLAAVWSGVLGVERVGVHDNFFELGGDSILSLQIVARVRAAELGVDVADVFAHQTIAELALVVREAPEVSVAEQGVVTGPVPLTPIQHWFLAQDVPNRDHWNWSGVFELAPGTDPERLRQAFDVLLAHHDALRLRFSPERQYNAGVEAADLLRVVEGDSDVVAEMTVAQKSLRLADGPLLAAVFFDRGDESAWLGLTVHHLVMDGVSWNVLLEDLGTAYRSEALGPKTVSFRQWAGHLLERDAGGERDHWAAATSDVVALPLDGDGPNTAESGAVVRTWLDASTTSALFGEAHRAYRTRADDLLLAALADVLGEWTGSDHVTVDLESHGREDLDLSRTVGWFTSIFPVRLSRREDVGGTVKAVKESLRSVPRRGVGYGALRWLHGEFAGAPERPVLFNYLGAFDAVDPAGLLRGELPADLAGPVEGPGGTRAYPLQLEVVREDDGRLRIEWLHSTNLHRAETVERVADRYVAALRALVEHCRSGVSGFTPSDFPLASLTQTEVDGLAERYRLADVHRLAPVQAGMLFGVVGSPVDGLYWGQGVYDLAGPVDAERLARAWREVISRHAALRSGFVWEGVSEPVQVVLAEVDVPLAERDWSGLDAATQQVRLRELLSEDRALGFDLAAPPLTRLYLVDRGEDRLWLVWGLYQGLCDGWSLPVVMDEVFASYDGETLAPARSYREFIAWLDRRDPDESEEFWRRALDGFEAPTPLPVDRPATNHYAQDRRRTALDEDVTAGLVELARRERVTLSTVVQAAWAKVLSASSGEDDVLFGLTVSGRPGDLAGVESMVGLFINTLPVRTTVPADVPFTSWLRELRDNQVAVQRFEYTPLVDVQRWSAVPGGRALFDSIVVFGNYPHQELPDDLDAVPGGYATVDSVEQGNYPLTFAVDLERRLRIEAEFSTAAFDAVTVERILDQLVVVLTAVARRPGLVVAEVPLQRPDQAAELVAWGETPVPAAEPPVPDLVRGWAGSGAVAVVCGEDSLTFAELDARAEALAARLRRAGVTAESPVAVLVPRGLDLAVAFQGVLRSGGVYVPINPGLPAERLAFLLADSGAVAVVTTSPLDGFAGAVLLVDDSTAPAEALPPVDPEALAYIAYTSGSTGRPKGVAVTHAALSSYVAGWRDGLAALGGPGTVLSMSGPGFDVSIGDMTRALAFGQTVVFLPHDEHVSVESLHATLVEHRIEIAEIVPGMLLRDLAAYCRTAGPVESLRLVISGTDMWTHGALTSAVAEVAPNAVPGNVFGVTEAAIDSIFHAVAEDHPAAVVPIGTPLAGARAVVVDSALRPVPVGVPGELLVGGAGVARGYLGRPDLTSVRFVPDLFGEAGGRLYRTGDRAKWRADGTIEFLGRVDEQVKIRGYRVEPGEVEVVIGDHPDVRDVVVVARDGGPHGGKRLVAYVVAEGEFDSKELRSWLRERVPDYLVPSVFVALERLPLTPNGKVDRRGLPEPEPETTGEAYVAPRTAVEESLAAVWSGVLGVERVGVHDNFFELGGDSILSLQIVARVRAAGLGVEVADVFAHQTIAALAGAVRDTPAVTLAEQGVVTGPVPLTPIQHWFLAQDIPNRDHWNWSGMFELAPGTDPERLGRALGAVVAHHDALRIRFTPESQVNAAVGGGGFLSVATGGSVVERMTEAQKSLRLADGPLLAAVFFDRGDEPAWLGLTVHHLVMDGVSWNILLEDLDAAYAGRELGPKTTSFRQWAEVLRELDARDERETWLAQTADVVDLPQDHHGPNDETSAGVVRSWLDADSTAALLGDAHRAYRTQGNDLLLAALAQALGEWTGTGHVTVDLESHGREAVADGVDLSRTVGWFTSIFPVRLTHESDPAAAIKAVKEELRAIPRRGVGYGALRWLQGDLAGAPDRPVLFNYLGAFDAVDSVGLIRRELPAELAGPSEGTGGTRSHVLQVEAQQDADGRLRVEWHFSHDLHDAPTVERVAERYVAALRALVAHCRCANGFTPSDFPLASLTQAEVDGLAERYPLVDVHRLAPVQSGMLFGVAGSPVDGLYWGQGVYDLTGPIDAGRLARAWRSVISRHAALRSVFVWEGVSEPVQVVLPDVEVPLERRDWSGLDAATQQVRLRELLDEDRALGFDLAVPPLTRLYLVDRGEGRLWLVWGLYQGLCDGWSLPVVMDEVSALYQGRSLEPARSYRDFIAWLDRRGSEEAEGFWRTYLSGFEAPTALPVDRLANSHYDQGRRRMHLDEAVTGRLVELARRQRVTLSTVVQAAWALLLSTYSGDDDVVFGLTVSGRPADLAGVESVVGLFINTLPVRASVPADTPFAAWLPALQDNQVALQRFEYTPLVDVQRWSAVPHGRALFDSIVVFGNYPQEELPEDLGGVRATESVEQGNYPLTFAVDLEDTLKIEAEFSTAAFDAVTVERILDQLAVVLTAVAERPGLAVREVPVQRPGQAAELVAWGATPVPAAEPPVPELIAARTSSEVAVVCGDERLTFAELNARADALAAGLRRAGVTAGSPVAVLVPRGLDLAVAFQGVLRSGGVYLPVNPGLPDERVEFLLADAGVVAAVATSPPAGFTGEVLSPDVSATVGEPLPPVDPSALAYIAYTSGSTGRPKGVAVTHAALSSYVAGWRDGLRSLGGPGTVLSMSGPGFDVSIGDMTRALAFGQRVVFLPHDEHVTVESLHRTLVDHQVEVAEIVPGMLLRDLAAHCRVAGSVESLRLVISGTDMWTHDALTGAVAEVAPNAVPGNVFGVTEAAIDSTFHAVVEDNPAAVVPIGTPLAGVRAFVVDGSLRPAPVGVPGELLVGGAGVAQGYVGRPDLTAERFVPDVFGGPGGRLYRTGDRARWRADGVLEFLGRVDEQVKIRGYRVEPGEVEVVIGDHLGVRDVVVVARDGGPHGGKRLVAYVVAEGGFDAKALRSWLRERVPDYLVPSVFVALDQLPLTPNGKVDRRGLPDPEPETAGVHEAPRSSTEDTLAAVWAQVLGVERVGVHDNFFELGGDSILSLQIVSRVRAAGLGVEVADVFAHQTIAELALAVRDTAEVTPAEQGVVTGPVPFTPIQRWFLAQDLPNRDHWNWSGVFELAPGTDPVRLGQALDALVAHHDALRIRFTPESQVNAPVGDGGFLRVVDGESVVERMTEAQKSLRLADGPLLAAVYFDRGDERAWLGLTVHHLVMDGVSWNVLLEDLDTAYRGGSLPPKTTSFQHWAVRLQDDDASGERDHWVAATADVVELPADGDGPNTEVSAGIVRSWLDAGTTAALLGDAHRAYRTQGHELLLTALARTLGEWAGSDHVTIDLESHGREGADLSRTVGWFTSIFPVRLSHHTEPGAAVKAVKEELRSVPRRGVGYGVLRWLRGELADAPDRPVLFNYLGAHDSADQDGLIRRELPAELAGPSEAVGGTRSHLLQLEVQQTADGRLSIEWFHSGNVHGTATVERVAARYVEALRELVAHCRAGSGFTPSDFPLASLTQAEVDGLAERYPLADVHRLAPVQSGMLFGVVGAPVDGLYWAQNVYDLAGPLDAERLAAAWREVIARHAPLRSGFVWEGVSEPVQVVLTEVDVPLALRDWSGLNESAQQVRLRELLAEDRALGFDLAAPPLTRLYLIERGEGRLWLVWSLYQGLCDGWSLPVVMDEVTAAYQRQALPPVRPYRDYIAWLDERDPGDTEGFWRTYLDGFEAPTPLPVDRPAA